MQFFLVFLVAAAAAATLFFLVRGLVGLAQGTSELNSARSQTLMRKRVAYQALAVVFTMLLLAAS